jgi:hypothetical protein
MNLLDERIDCRQSVDRETWVETRADFIAMAQYKGIADTIVQLIRRRTSGVIAPSQPTARLHFSMWTPADCVK